MGSGRRPGRRSLALVAALFLVLGLWQLGGGLAILAKAWLAQVLLTRAWTVTLAGEGAARPWPWADTWPVARLQVPALDVDQIVLAGSSGRSLAFGPGLMDGTARPGAVGHAILGGHRDTHFAFLQDLKEGMAIRVQRPDGRWQSYQVIGQDVIDHREARIGPAPDRPVMTLVTCYPFDDWRPGGPLRYLVFAEGVD